jgi:hypothetical protein
MSWFFGALSMKNSAAWALSFYIVIEGRLLYRRCFPTQCPDQRSDNEKHEEYDEQYLCDLDRYGGDAAETKNAGNNCHNQKC